MTGRKVEESFTVMTELVMPNDTNPLGNLMGGNLLKWMDVASSICAMKHCNSVVVTAAVDNVSFRQPIRLGEVVTIEARVTRAFRTSMEIHLEVFKRSFQEGRTKCNDAFYTFVSLDEYHNKQQVPAVIPETDLEKKLYESALRGRELRLILGGKMKPEEAKELKSLFLGDVIEE